MKLFRKIKGKLGFTLAEMLIVVAILAILTAVAAPNVAKYSRSINLRELNDSARAIYMAAEHKFMNEIEMGRTLPDGAAVNTNALEKRYGGDASAVNVKYLKSESTDLQKLMTSGSAAGDSTGVIESQLYDNNYIVEYNPETGDVFGVFYSEDDDLSEYETDFYPSISDMQKEKLIGYYGSDNVKPEEKTNSEVLPKPEVSIKNKEKLVLTITSPNFLNTENKVYIAVKICDAADNKKSVELIPRNGKIYMTPNKTVHFILDTLSDTLTDYTTSAELTDVKLKVFEKPFSEWATDDFGNYLIDPGAKLDIYVTFYDDKGKSIDRTVKVSANSLFADSSSLTEADIEYGRHLQNLDKCSAINTAVIKKTINFASTAGNYEGWESTYHDRQFSALITWWPINVTALSGAEIQNMQAINGGLFDMVANGSSFSNLTFQNCKINADFMGGHAGTLFAVSTGEDISLSNITVINPRVSGTISGGIFGASDGAKIDNCKVYVDVSNSSSWDDPENDPYNKDYFIEGAKKAGGITGEFQGVSISNSYAAVKVVSDESSGIAGGLIGALEKEAVIENSFAAGHTYKGTFEGKLDDGTEFSLKDNVKGATAGGIVGSCNDGMLKLSGTVFSTCSVSGTTVDPAYNGTAVTDGATVYTLGTAYKDNGGGTFEEIKKSADPNVKTGDDSDVKVDDSSATVGKRYDLKVSSVYKYKLPTGMTMHGDWPSSDEDISGFFYWEEHGGNYYVHVLCSGKEYENLCKKQDGVGITGYGYGAFSVGGSLDSAVTFSDGTSTDVTNADVESAVQTALAAVDDLKITDSGTVAVKLYNVTGVSGTGFVTATVGGNDYTFAPDFYAISADKGSDHAGTDANVFGVRSDSHLKKVGSYPDGSFKQSHDIDLEADTTGLTPIGDSTNKFAGAYDGGSYRIINAKFNTTADSDYAGLFGVTENATLKNIVVFNEAATADKFVEIKGKTVGGLVAKSTGDTIKNCVVSGYTITGDTASGGIVGDSTGTKIETCEANVKLSGDGNVGGIAGSADSTSTIDNCYALVHGYDGKADETLGGIAGKATTVTNCYVIFSGQISGYPVANISVTGTDYYVKEKGYYQGNPKLGNYGQKQTYNQLKTTEQKEDNQLSYSEKATDNDKKYEFKALVEDKVKHVPVHYGPTPPKAELDTETLTEGPLVGIFNVKQYQDSGYDSNDYDGLMVYNRSGMLNWDEVVIDGTGKRHVGIFIANPDDPQVASKPYLILDKGIYSEKLAVYVNGERVEPERFKAYGITAGVGRARSGYYHYGFSDDPTVKYSNATNDGTSKWITDTFYDSAKPGADANIAFMYYVICKDDGTEMTPDEIESIEIKYDNPETGIKGSLLRADKEKQSLNNTDHMAYLPASRIDEWEMPEIGAFIAGSNYGERFRPEGMPRYVYPYSMKLTITKDGVTTTKGESFHHEVDGVIGIVVRKDQIDQYYDGNIKFQVNSIPVELVPWEEAMHVDICNADALGLDDYEVFVVKESAHIDPSQFNTSWIDFTAVHGSKVLFKYTYGTLLQGTTEGKTEKLMPDFVLATLYTNASGTAHYAKGFKAGAKTYPPEESGSDNNSAQYPTTKTNSYVFITTGSTSDFTVRINGNTFVDIGEETDMVTNLTWHFSGKAYTINILGDDVDSIEVYYKGELIMSKEASEF